MRVGVETRVSVANPVLFGRLRVCTSTLRTGGAGRRGGDLRVCHSCRWPDFRWMGRSKVMYVSPYNVRFPVLPSLVEE